MDTFTLRGCGLSQVDVHPAIQALAAGEPVFLNFLDERVTVNNFSVLVGRMSYIAIRGSAIGSTEALSRCGRWWSDFLAVHPT